MTDFDEAAATWDDEPDRIVRAEAIAEVIRTTVALDERMEALEYGSGTGLLGRALVGDLAHLTLADASEGMTRTAREKIATHPHAERLSAIRLDLSTDPVPAERYDLIVSMMALHHVADVPALLSCFGEMLRPGGRVALVDLDAEDGSFHDHEGEVHHGFGRQSFADWLGAAGFDEISLRTAYTIEREHDGQVSDYPLFLATARRR